MVMQNSVLDPQDQRKTSSMEDSTAMTIEFLRARLLSERSVSRSARQRADELAKEVMELEEQLRVVTLQRKMAEKATVDVLAILENQGINDVFEENDFSSDLEIPCDSGVRNDSVSAKGNERSDVDSSPAAGNSLSWKGCLDSSRSLEKYKTSKVRRRSSFSSISSSPKHCLGKSCRRLKHRETRSVEEESRDKFVNFNCQWNESGSSSEGFLTGSNGEPNILRRECKIQEQDESALKLASENHDVDGERENMERALEHQARLIDQYGAMEKAQREWEEKYRDNNSSTPESCDLGNHSDITEERDESKAQIPWSARVVISSAQEDGSEPRGFCLSEEMLEAKPRDNMPKSFDDTGYNNQNSKPASTPGFLGQENSHSLLKGNQKESQENCHSQPTDQHHHSPRRHDFPHLKPTDSFPTDVYSGLPEKDAGRNNNHLYELVYHDQSREFSGVLESLKQAKDSHSLLKGSQMESQENCHSQPTDQHHHGPRRHDFPDLKPADSFPTDICSGLPHKDAGRNNSHLYELVYHDQSREFSGALESLKQAKNSHSLLKRSQMESQENCHSPPTDQRHHGPRRHDFHDLKPTDSFPTDVYSGLPRKDAGRNNNDLNELVSHDQSCELSAVLESLKQAKLCLQQKINKLPLVDRGYTGKAIKTSALVSKTEDKFEIPVVSCSSLFRLPTDFFDEEAARINFHDLNSGFSSNFYPGRDISQISGGQFGTTNLYSGTVLSSSADDQSLAPRYTKTGSRFDTRSSGFSSNFYPGRDISRISGSQFGTTDLYSGTMLSSSANNQSLATRYTETGSRFDTERVPSVPFMDGGLFSSGKYLNPSTFPISSSYQNATPPMPYGEGLSRTYSSSTAGVPPAYQFSFHGDH